MQTQLLSIFLAVSALTLFLFFSKGMSFHDQTQVFIVGCVVCCISYSNIVKVEVFGDTLFDCNFLFLEEVKID